MDHPSAILDLGAQGRAGMLWWMAQFLDRLSSRLNPGPQGKLMMKLLRDRRGATMVEYIILIGIVVLLSVGAFRTFGFRVRGTVDTQSQKVSQDIDDE